ncbi:DNA methyltransferase [Gemmatimonas sp.]|uniref:class I SAM-dependent DNA methyltransferase n=1 Tax=Gemmatimonas sp. TaxID=1962908 RepID=UPI0025BF99A9|nr:DNA methyltransferase [Gemmatimonas sp.]MCA2993253.1 class I SAM-dependent DNA methyltransferase [Gemmatimonas sp.]
MNAVEIEEAISALVEQPFDAAEFPYDFLAAFGNKETTLRRLRSGHTNKSDVGGVLQRANIHLAVAPVGDVTATLTSLRASPATAKHNARFILATDGARVEAEDLESGEPLACDWAQLPDHFGFFLPLAGITTVRQIRENAFDIRATSKLNKLYVELLKTNPEWGTDERRADMNHFMARLIFSFFAEDTGITADRGLFSSTVTRMSAPDSSNTHDVIRAVFKAMNTRHEQRAAAGVPRWALPFPYVNGGLFAGSEDVPRFSRTARAYLLQVGSLDWKQINPDIFGSMIQAVADDDERWALGMHYTSVPNILKVLNPLFLDDLRVKLEEAGDNPRTLLNLRKRLARIRVFDPACGSGNFLVIAYKELRKIEHEINRRRGEAGRRSDIPLTNFRGIELRDFSAEIARLALVIAEFQCDELYRGQQEAIREFLPLSAENWITCGNALRIDWLSVCPPTGTAVKLMGDDLFSTPLDQSEIDFENAGGETYICGNPPYLGSTWQSAEQKADLRLVFEGRTTSVGSLDYVAGWFMKAADYGRHTRAATAFVTTNSICQGQQVPVLWPIIFGTGHVIHFAHTSFAWANLASHNAGVTVAIVGLSNAAPKKRMLYSIDDKGEVVAKEAENINAYLMPGQNVIVTPRDNVIGKMAAMDNGNKAVDGGHLLLEPSEVAELELLPEQEALFVKRFAGSFEAINGAIRFCLWIPDSLKDTALQVASIASRIKAVEKVRLQSPKKMTRDSASRPHAFQQVRQTGTEVAIVVPRVSSERREYLPSVLMGPGTIISDKAFAMYDAPLWSLSLITSRLHWVWIGTVCVRMRTDFSYSNTLGWNTFPVPPLSEQNKADLTRCAEGILLAREVHYPATIADLYDPDTMPDNLREAHERNDEVLERIYIGRRFRNDTERLEKLFAMYTQMTAAEKRVSARAGQRA